MAISPLSPSQLGWTAPPDVMDGETTADVAPLDRFIGQDSALAALRRALEMKHAGFNVFVVGLRSTSRLGTVQRMLAEMSPRRRVARDLVYVKNFLEPARPRLLVLPPGRGVAFRKELLRVAAVFIERVPAILRSSDVRRARDRQEDAAAVAHHASVVRLQERAAELGFMVAERSDGDDTIPVVLWVVPPPKGRNGRRASTLAEGEEGPEPEAITRAELQVLVETGKIKPPAPLAEMMAHFDQLEELLAEAQATTRIAVTESVRKVAEAEAAAIRAGTSQIFEELAADWPQARAWLEDLHEELVESPEWFDEEEPDHDALFAAFTANLVHSGSRSRKAPVVVVPNPTWQILLGGIEGEPGDIDHGCIRGGALIDADGGFLLLNAADMLQEPGVWKVLKRALTYGEFEIQNPESPAGTGAVVLRPQSLTLDVRVLLVGDVGTYALMYYGDPDFASIFKIKAEFEDDAVVTPELLRQYVGFVARLVTHEHLPHLERGAVARVLEWAVRQAAKGGRITTRFGPISDLVREAAVESRGARITRAHVDAALRARRDRDDLAERRVLESMRRGDIRVETSGTRVGQVNGLAVYHVGGHDFGRPLRITATVGVGRSGVVSIEREAGLSGRAHDKGIQILSGILRDLFGQTRTFAFSAAVGFEQSYGRIDGDSASSAEVYAILSALAGVPLRQDLAVTGSINQFREIQTIGAVNEKIEGFFAACNARGPLTGTQGVIIPRHNVADLCLHDDVRRACEAGLFAVYAVDHLDEALGLLTGAPPGAPDAAGAWPADSFFGKVAATLDRYQDIARLQGRPPGKDKGEAK